MAKESKAYGIIRNEFDTRCCTMIIAYILDTGMQTIASITDADIDALKGNGLMTEDFEKALVKTARKVCRECDVNEIVKLIQSEWAAY